MTSIRIQRVVRQSLCLAIIPFLACGLLVAQQPLPPAQPLPQPGQQPEQSLPQPEQSSQQLMAPQQLDTMVAPVALYPDALLSQVLAASTYPLEIAEAAQWLKQNSNLQGPQLVDAARQQNWDPSIQALVVFPEVLDRLSSDIRWTTDLGNAFLAQQADVMNAVQRLRLQAMAAGKLKSNQQQTVTTERQGDQSAIDIQPTNPEVVYVPVYNPQYIWGPPAYGYYPPWAFAGVGVGFGFGYGFGPGIYIGSFFGGLGWGGWGWGPNWFHSSIFLNRPFFGRFGYGVRGFGVGGAWAHDPGHRMGVPYANSALSHRFGGASMARSVSPNAGARYNSASRAGTAQAGGMSRFGQAGPATATQGAQRSSYRAAPASGGSSAYRASPSSSSSYGANRSTPSYRASSGSSGYSGSRATPSYRSSPSSSGGGPSRSGGSSHSSGGGGHHR